MPKVVFITGASGGIGREMALAFGSAGNRVVLHCYKHREKAVETLEEMKKLGMDAILVEGDISNPSEVKNMFSFVLASFGHVEILVHNAGFALQKLFTDTSQEEWRQMFAVHVDGAYYCAQEVIPEMVRKKRGKILFLSSVWGMAGASCEVAYSAAKAALIGMGKALAKELGPSGIQVNCLAPGAVQTQMMDGFSQKELSAFQEEIPLRRLGTPKEIARWAVFLTSSEGDYLTGQVISPNGGLVI